MRAPARKCPHFPDTQPYKQPRWHRCCVGQSLLQAHYSCHSYLCQEGHVFVAVCLGLCLSAGKSNESDKGRKFWNINGLLLEKLYFSKRTIGKQKKVNISNLKTTKFRIRMHFISQGIKWCLSFHFFKAFLLTVHLFSKLL